LKPQNTEGAILNFKNIYIMEDNFDKANEWFERSESFTDLEEHKAFIMETFDETSFTVNFARNAGIGDALMNIIGHLESQKRFDEILDLMRKIKEIRPDFYDAEYVYLNEPILYYALFTQNEALAIEFFAPFINDPIQNIDCYLPLLRLICLYGKGEWVEHIVLQNYEIIKNADGFIGAPHRDIALYLWHHVSEKEYKKFKETGVFDMDSWLSKLAQVDFDNFETADIQYFEDAFTKPIPDKTYLEAEFQKNTGDLLRLLQTHFSKYAYDNYQIPFVSGGIIWELMTDFWFRDNTKKANFNLTTKNFDKFCGQFGGFFNGYTCNIFASVWGAYYAYDFLYQIGLITDLQYKNALIGIRYSQDSINKFNAKLWHFGFTKYWTKPNSMTDIEYAINVKAIDEAFAEVNDTEYKAKSFGDTFEGTLDNLLVNAFEKKLQALDAPRKEPKPQRIPKPIQKLAAPKVPRNAPCPCGSGKKYKNCCDK
jgi:hypothetical protein